MNNNVEIFRNYLTEIEIGMDEQQGENSSIFRTKQKLKNSGQIIGIAIIISKEIDVVDIQIFDFVTFNNPLKEDLCYRLINEINASKRFSTFYIDSDKDVIVRQSLDVTYDFNPKAVIDMLLLLLDSADENYGKFMKIMWS